MMGNINSFIDHTLLRPDATKEDIVRLLKETSMYGFASACIAPCWLDERIDEHIVDIKIATVIGFPHGNVQTGTKINQIKSAVANEYDVVANIGDIKSGKWKDVEFEIMSLRKATKATLKYIVEVGYLTDSELLRIADLLMEHKIDFIKTCTGYGPRNVAVDDIKKIRAHTGDRILIKASGGIKTKAFAEDLIAAGADRIGTSSGIAIFSNTPSQAAY